jgi:hypothetical protein
VDARFQGPSTSIYSAFPGCVPGLLLSCITAQSSALKPIDPAALQNIVDATAKELLIPGALVLLRTPQGEFVVTYGTTLLSAKSPPCADTYFRAHRPERFVYWRGPGLSSPPPAILPPRSRRWLAAACLTPHISAAGSRLNSNKGIAAGTPGCCQRPQRVFFPLRFAHPVKIRSSATTPVTDLVH